MKVKISITDDQDQLYEGELELTKSSTSSKTENKKTKKKAPSQEEKNWYQKGSTIEKILKLVKSGFFDTNRTISDIISKLKEKDYHLSSSDLTLPLRKIVRKDILIKTKDLPDGTKSSRWTYVKV